MRARPSTQIPGAKLQAIARRPGVSRCSSSTAESRLSASARGAKESSVLRAPQELRRQNPTTSAQTICREARDTKEDDRQEPPRARDNPSPPAESSEKTESQSAGRRLLRRLLHPPRPQPRNA